MSTSISVTRCPSCQTAFHVTEEELGAASGQVRCGSCLEVFLAREEMIVEQKSLFNQLDEQPTQPTEKKNYSEQPDPEYFLGSDRPNQEVQAKPQSKLWAIAVLLLMIIVPLQLVYWQPPQLIRFTWYPAFLERSCEILNCEVRSIDQLQLIDLNGSVQGTADPEILVAHLRITNRAPISQPLPNLILQFQNLQGRETASREFLPNEYSPKSDKQSHEENGQMIYPGEVIEVQLDLIDPGPSSVNYEFWMRSSKTAGRPL